VFNKKREMGGILKEILKDKTKKTQINLLVK